MNSGIIKVIKKECFLSTKSVSEMLDVPHDKFMRTVNTTINRLENTPHHRGVKFPPKFIKSTFKNKMGRSYEGYEMNEQAYMILVMQLSKYDKAWQIQQSIIEAFSLMKESLLQQSNATWLSIRDKTKLLRKEETEVIQELVEYATNQGSVNAKMYYSNITKMTNKALEFLCSDGTPIRDLANIEAQGYIQVADNIAKNSILRGMKDNLPYKYIYKMAKENVNAFTDTINLKLLD